MRSYLTRMPGCAPLSTSSRKMPGCVFSSVWLADRIIPSLTPNFILRGARLATSTTMRPISFFGSP